MGARTSVILADLLNSATSKLIERLWWRVDEGPDPLGGECGCVQQLLVIGLQ